MSKTIKNVFDEKLTFTHLATAHVRASKNKRNRKEVMKFNVDLECHLINLLENIKNNKYRLGKYREFVIYEPKKRIIKSLPYIDRIVHQWYVEEFIKPYIIKRFIKDTYACIDGRGTHQAVLTTRKYMRKMKQKYEDYYIVKCDIRKYFYNIDKHILFRIMQKYITDKKLLEFTKVLIFDGTGDIGIPIGNYTSQFFANIYLNELDHYIKDQLRIKYYVRYMDDFILLASNKEEAKYLKQCVNDFVTSHLHLELNEKSRYYPNAMGVNFCGYRIFESHILLRTESKKKIKRKVKKWNLLYQKEQLNIQKAYASWNSWLAHSSHSNSYHLQKRIYDKILFKEEMLRISSASEVP